MSGKTGLVVGASEDIGFESAKALLEDGGISRGLI
jgi:NAD(P)-dependent dehydrogenase (short-subunit alcohol dehydrogenase family)